MIDEVFGQRTVENPSVLVDLDLEINHIHISKVHM